VPILLPFVGDTVIVVVAPGSGSGGDAELLRMGIAPGKEEDKENRREQNSPGIFKKGKRTHKKLLYGLMMVQGDNPGGGPRRSEPGKGRPEQDRHTESGICKALSKG
jgi:hypothetical protein